MAHQQWEAPVTFRETVRRPDATYHVHAAPNKRTALAFLRQTPVKDALVYVIVETPEGNLGRDLICIFEERSGQVLELALVRRSTDLRLNQIGVRGAVSRWRCSSPPFPQALGAGAFM